MWRGREKIMHGVDSIVEVTSVKCTKDFRVVREDQFCVDHPEFWLTQPVGLKSDAV